MQVPRGSATTTQVDPAAVQWLMRDENRRPRGVNGGGGVEGEQVVPPEGIGGDGGGHSDGHHRCSSGAAQAGVLPAEGGVPRGEGVGGEGVGAGMDDGGSRRTHRYREEGDDSETNEVVRHAEVAVYGGPEARVDRGWGLYDAQKGDAHARSVDGPRTRPRTAPSWRLSRGQTSTGHGAAPFFGMVSASGTPGATASAASAGVNREFAPHHRERDAQKRWRGYRGSYPTLRATLRQLARACEEEQRAKKLCLSSMTTTAAAMTRGTTSGNGASRC
ncbi:hypothetical protein CUR178_07493 [Leishmania enriettii]|uniref:Uncharacterized protein n=1 Tax=Leishmania enriettii TaxID=5663 RepID=A0A836KSP4_LEIEN|nr:hypothetical protein CUR178_07493 [Leishmania enriettii]